MTLLLTLTKGVVDSKTFECNSCGAKATFNPRENCPETDGWVIKEGTEHLEHLCPACAAA